jgi:hypothetical protein
MPSFSETLISVCNIPRDFPTSSLKGLVERSGYLTHRQEITSDLIEEHVRAHPHLIDEWNLYSGNKRGGSPWYLYRPDTDAPFVVGNIKTREQTLYDDSAKACAHFVKMEVESSASRISPPETAAGE